MAALTRQHKNSSLTSAYEVLPADLVDQLIKSRGGTFRVTFSMPGHRPNPTEEAVPVEFRAAVRKAVDQLPVTQSRSIYFGGHKKRRRSGDEADAIYLLKEVGVSKLAARIAIGVSHPTFAKWIRGADIADPDVVLDFSSISDKRRERYREKGLARCREMHVQQSEYRMDSLATEVGYALSALTKRSKGEK